jgi:hypothetical protein
MADKQENINTFASMEKETSSETTKEPEKMTSGGEIDLDDFSDKAIGDSTKYVRVDLHDKEDVIDNFQVFPVDVEKDELQQSRTKDSEYWRVSVCMTYKSVNEDGMQNREYISGCIAFKQRDGQASAPHFWYEGCKHQSGMLWELVAKHLNVPPQDMSPRQFVAFLKSKPRVKITGVEYDNFGARKGDPAKVKKNMVGEFL